MLKSNTVIYLYSPVLQICLKGQMNIGTEHCHCSMTVFNMLLSFILFTILVLTVSMLTGFGHKPKYWTNIWEINELVMEEK